jgi:hypothetical protein
VSETFDVGPVPLVGPPKHADLPEGCVVAEYETVTRQQVIAALELLEKCGVLVRVHCDASYSENANIQGLHLPPADVACRNARRMAQDCLLQFIEERLVPGGPNYDGQGHARSTFAAVEWRTLKEFRERHFMVRCMADPTCA